MRLLARVVLPLGLAVGVLTATTACSGGAPSPGPSPAPSVKPTPDAKSTAPESTTPPTSDTPATPPASLSCETLIPSDTVAALHKQGWAAMKRDFAFGPEPVPGGIECLWSDPAIASDHGLLYGWAPIAGADAKARQEQLVASGWIREDSSRGVYITADPRASLSQDEDGYGMTYLFGPGWVTVSDTKQGLVLIDPRS
ncbi:MAG: hypothetical protein B7X41_19865 [Microbacterium sp. 14-71-5]|jgi:hypothetical protein|uniref:hypothetical protein n=1 Tax=Microbacterium sp. 13-71-7 TaxID=1970399 RepID=UPI000BC853EF|nr:hypothetical protein [Microbacterium sp. 13-71-7]OZB78705.1 MAG: hypothetical protein B7X41_19865 [Microbacterium sp. 14-71-5]OZB83356.1 MAG: hypothetical protein B7X32_10595 [Microbacterium sp. 13-71-7]